MLAEIASVAGNVIGGLLGNKQADKQAKLQKQFAQQGIQWKVADAKKAGIHPLAALGAQTMSYAPQQVGGGLATGLANAGQDIARAVDATRSQTDKLGAYEKTIQDLNIQRMGLENQLLSSQIAKVNQTGPKPGMPDGTDRFLIEGQSNSPLVQPKPLDRIQADPSSPESEAGAVTDMGYSRTQSGWAPVMSKDFQERAEEDLLGTLAWNLRNRLAPAVSSDAYNPPSVPRNYDEYWIYNPVTQEYQLKKRTNRRSWWRAGPRKWKG